MNSDDIRRSKFLSFVLRHGPESIGVVLDPQGWTPIAELITKSCAAGTHFTEESLLHVIETSDKKRFSLSADGKMVRAAQGHSVDVDLGLAQREPPEFLFHGTATRFLTSILLEGLTRKSRQQVHLSADELTAEQIGKRHGSPVVLRVEALRMHQMGFQFRVAENGVWLVDKVPAAFLVLPVSSLTKNRT